MGHLSHRDTLHHFSCSQCKQWCYKWNSEALEYLRNDLSTHSVRLFEALWIAKHLESRFGDTAKYYNNRLSVNTSLATGQFVCLKSHSVCHRYQWNGTLTLCLPQPDKTTRSGVPSSDVGSAIGWTSSVNMISSAVRIKAMSFTSSWRLNPACGVIVSSSTSTPPFVWRNAPTSAYTFDGSPLSLWQQCAAVNKNRLLMMDAPQ